jgi:hypothetical protein
MSSSQVLDSFHARNLPTRLIACYISPTFTFSSWGFRIFSFASSRETKVFSTRGYHGAVTEMYTAPCYTRFCRQFSLRSGVSVMLPHLPANTSLGVESNKRLFLSFYYLCSALYVIVLALVLCCFVPLCE